ncbi:MAG: hypothetical protein CMD42_04865 [Gammaproteobacteria bacterium]|nr:hypothetical protein [Gammaproteobacteria bacterium]|tara:strand:+ start:386 stop:736 length:351 start_codon:yes stop_codon:yes gene_type:complete
MEFLNLSLLENAFLELLGFNLSGPVGLFFGLVIFCLLLIFFRYEGLSVSKTEEVSNFEEVGDPTEAKINLSRSYIEMGKYNEASIYLKEVLALKHIKKNQREVADLLLARIDNDQV